MPVERYLPNESELDFDVAGSLSGEFGRYLDGHTNAPSLSVMAYDGIVTLELTGGTGNGVAMTILNLTNSMVSEFVPGTRIAAIPNTSLVINGDVRRDYEGLEIIGCTGPELEDWTEDFPASSVDIAVDAHPEASHVSRVTFTAHFDPEEMKQQVLRAEREYYADVDAYTCGDEGEYDCGSDSDSFSLTDDDILSMYEFPDRPMHITGSFTIIRPPSDR